jgi:CheY-like chemotaxis protein
MATILLVEDDEAVRRLIEQHLVEVGHSVIAAPDTGRAMQDIEGPRSIDLMLVDLVMPVDQQNGLVFASNVRVRLPRVPAIFITGYYGFVARAGELPGPILYKPIDLEVLTREISAQLVT